MPFQYKGATIRAHELTIGDEEDTGVLCMAITGTESWMVKHTWFAQYQFAAEVEGSEPILRVTTESSIEDIRAAYQAWRKLPGSFRDLWTKELERVEKAAKNESASPS